MTSKRTTTTRGALKSFTVTMLEELHAAALIQAERNGMDLTAFIRNLLRWSSERDVSVAWVCGCPRFGEASKSQAIIPKTPMLNSEIASALVDGAGQAASELRDQSESVSAPKLEADEPTAQRHAPKRASQRA